MIHDTDPANGPESGNHAENAYNSSTGEPVVTMQHDMDCDQDKWREIGRRAAERMEAAPRIVRFSRRLLVVSALLLIAIGVFNLL